MQSSDSEKNRPAKIYKICLTGGPCAGKTTALESLKIHLTDLGFKVFTVPEVPTLTMQGGGMIVMEGLTKEKVYKFQQLLMKAQMNLEDYFYSLAELYGKKAVILYDRGVMDPKAYMDEETWQGVLDDSGWNPVYLRDKRYDVVLHLITAADGAEKYYTLENNAARYETVEIARQVDQNLIKAWSGHPHQIIVDNSGPDFQDKVRRTINSVGKFIGIPVKKDLFRKFMIESFQFPENFKKECFDVEEIYLKPREDYDKEYIRKRGNNGAYSYAHTCRLKGQEQNMRCETKSSITARDYMNLTFYKDPNTNIIKKKRYAFIYEKQSFVMEVFETGLCLLRLDANDINSNIKFPEFLKVGKEVTDDESFSTQSLCKAK